MQSLKHYCPSVLNETKSNILCVASLPPGPKGRPPADTRQPAITIPDGQFSAVTPVHPPLWDRVVIGEYADFLNCCPHLSLINTSSAPLHYRWRWTRQLRAICGDDTTPRSVCVLSVWLEAWTVYLSIMTRAATNVRTFEYYSF